MHAIKPNSPAWDYVITGLRSFWSPEAIAMRWRKEHPLDTLGVSTIYRYIKDQRFPGITRESHQRRRGKRKYPRKANCTSIQPDRIIPQWPPEISLRLRMGDWEGDTVYGGVGKGLLVTFVDRRSRYLCAGLLRCRDATETREAIQHLLNGLPVHSISLDNGAEFAQFRQLEEALQAPVYFAEPHKPWQRGTNENTNDILRFFFPKGYDFHSLSPQELEAVVDSINNRPKKCLGWLSPREVFFS